MLALRKMTDDELSAYLETSIPNFAAEVARARDLAPEAAMAAALASFDRLLPDRKVDSPDQHLYLMVAEGQPAGVLWFGIKRDQQRPYAYVWEIVVYPEQRGRGYGKQAMLLLEDKVRELSLASIVLNVFGHNQVARSLYEGLGYVPTSLTLTKEL